MFVGKELLLSCIVMISFVASQPIKLEEFRKNVKAQEMFSFRCHLQAAENDYVKHVFGGETPKYVEPLEGITFGNTTEEIQASICAITDCLDTHLPTIIKNVTQSSDLILYNTRRFLKFFNDTVQKSRGGQNETCVPKGCQTNAATSDNYTKKIIGFRIITSTRKWMEITGTPPSCIGL